MVRLQVLGLGAALVAGVLAPGAASARTVAEVRQVQAEAASRAFAAASAAYSAGTGSLESVYAWSVRWLEVERSQAGDVAGRRAAAGRHLARMQKLAGEVARRVAVGLASALEGDAVAFYAAEAEAWLLGEVG